MEPFVSLLPPTPHLLLTACCLAVGDLINQQRERDLHSQTLSSHTTLTSLTRPHRTELATLIQQVVHTSVSLQLHIQGQTHCHQKKNDTK